ncbi:MAG TPA: response regulator [Nitrospiraceae bacterium]|nr:response regulator [Nitrospiraceae bacterium]
MRRQRQQLLLHVVLPLALPLGVLIVTTQLFPLLAEASFMAALAVVVTSAWFAGWTGGIVACAVSFVGLSYFVLPPFHSFRIDDLQQVIRWISFLPLSLLMIAVTTNRQRAYQKIEAANTSLKQAENELLMLRDRLARELREMTRLHELSGQLLTAQDLPAMLEQILKASIELFGGEMGTIQLYDEREDVLRMAAHIGLTEQFYEEFKAVPMEYSCCGAAMKQRRRIIIENVFSDPQFQQFALVYAKHGFVACQSTPLYSSNGTLLGMLSNHFPRPHCPSERELQLLDMYAQQAERVIERKQAQEALEQANADLQSNVQARTTELLIKHQQLRSLAQQLAQIEEGERKNLARDLHDNLAQNLVLAKMRLAALEHHHDQPRMIPIVDELKDLVDHAVTYVRTLMGDLRPTLLGDEDDVSTAIQWVIEKMSRYGLHVSVDDDGKTKRLEEEALVLAYHSVHEFLFNVLKHARTRKATVMLRNVADNLEITVSDDGQGFDMAAKHVPSGKGGFGLFSIKERIALLGGRCEIVSDRGKGTRATLVMPLSRGSHQVDQRCLPYGQKLSNDHISSIAQGVRVLLVDDHAVMREGLRSLLQNDMSLEVVGEAGNGKMAIELVRALQPHVIVMDCEMPQMNGFEATRRIKRDFPNTLIIGLSFLNDPGTAAAMRACGASAFLSKEQAVNDLLKTIHSVTEPQEMASANTSH